MSWITKHSSHQGASRAPVAQAAVRSKNVVRRVHPSLDGGAVKYAAKKPPPSLDALPAARAVEKKAGCHVDATEPPSGTATHGSTTPKPPRLKPPPAVVCALTLSVSESVSVRLACN